MASKNKRSNGKRVYVPHEERNEGPSWIWILICLMIPGVQPVGGILLLVKLLRMWQNRKQIDYQSYAAIIGNRVEVDVRELSAKLGKSTTAVMYDLQTMISKGYLGSSAYLDKGRGMLITDATETENFDVSDVIDKAKRFVVEISHTEPKRDERIYADTKSEPIEVTFSEPKAKPQPVRREIREVNSEPAKKRSAAPSVKQNDDFEETLRKIRDLNDQIDDREVSASIDRIGSLTADIFRVVRQKPEKADEVRKFMNYYLPITLKLLQDYALMEKQSYQGKNIQESRDKIEELLKTLITAFERQLDKLFSADALDVEADISVLQTMMAKDGLVQPKGLDIHDVMGGH